MPEPSQPLRKLGFLTIGLFDEADPRRGHETTLEIIELGERLGFDSAWVRHRHLQYGISSPVAVLAAASQRTSRIELGTAVIPLGWENPLRLAEDLATVDILSGGRLNPGVSVGPPMHYDQVKDALYPDTAEVEDFGYERVRRLLDFVRGEAGHRLQRGRGFRGLLRPGPALLPRPRRPHVVRRRQPELGPVGGRARHELPDQQRREGGGVRGFRRHPALPHPGVPRAPPRRRPGPRLAGPGGHPHRLAPHPSSGPSTRSTRPSACPGPLRRRGRRG